MRRLSPPYGDGMHIIGAVDKQVRFSPPYGDGTNSLYSLMGEEALSPPYGDGTSVGPNNIKKG